MESHKHFTVFQICSHMSRTSFLLGGMYLALGDGKVSGGQTTRLQYHKQIIKHIEILMAAESVASYLLASPFLQ